jgi:hypothetical protein
MLTRLPLYCSYPFRCMPCDWPYPIYRFFPIFPWFRIYESWTRHGKPNHGENGKDGQEGKTKIGKERI